MIRFLFFLFGFSSLFCSKTNSNVKGKPIDYEIGRMLAPLEFFTIKTTIGL